MRSRAVRRFAADASTRALDGTTSNRSPRSCPAHRRSWRGASRRVIVGLSGCLVLGVAGCADDLPDAPLAGGSASTTAGAAGAANEAADANGAEGEQTDGNGVSITVQALDNTFRVQDLVVDVGTEVVFENVGRNEHNVIPEPDSVQGWGVGEDAFAPGDVYTHVFTEPGVYAYVCTIHGVNGKGMVGTVTVRPAG